MNNITAAILILASVGLFFGYINPTYRKDTGEADRENKSVRELLAERAEYNMAIEKAREIELTRTGLLAKYNSIAVADRERLERMLPDHSDTVRLVIDINTIAAANNITLKNIAVISGFSPASSRQGAIGPRETLYETIELNFGLSGSYEAFRLFLEDLERNLRLIDVVSVRFAAPETDMYDYEVKIRTYRLK